MIDVLGLILLANAVPILVAQLFGSHANWPLDLGLKINQQPILGPSKTWRGIVASLAVTSMVAEWFGLSAWDGLLIASTAMLGDIIASFCKRRLKIKPSDMALGLDQIPESLFPTLAMKQQLAMSWGDVFIMVVLFIFIELLLSRLGYMLGLRNRPY